MQRNGFEDIVAYALQVAKNVKSPKLAYKTSIVPMFYEDYIGHINDICSMNKYGWSDLITTPITPSNRHREKENKDKLCMCFSTNYFYKVS